MHLVLHTRWMRQEQRKGSKNRVSENTKARQRPRPALKALQDKLLCGHPGRRKTMRTPNLGSGMACPFHTRATRHRHTRLPAFAQQQATRSLQLPGAGLSVEPNAVAAVVHDRLLGGPQRLYESIFLLMSLY